jgi:hypothetical protein
MKIYPFGSGAGAYAPSTAVSASNQLPALDSGSRIEMAQGSCALQGLTGA